MFGSESSLSSLSSLSHATSCNVELMSVRTCSRIAGLLIFLHRDSNTGLAEERERRGEEEERRR